MCGDGRADGLIFLFLLMTKIKIHKTNNFKNQSFNKISGDMHGKEKGKKSSKEEDGSKGHQVKRQCL